MSWFRSSLRRRSEAPPGAPARDEVGNGGPSAETRPEEAAPPPVAVASPEELVGRPLADLHALAREHGLPRYRLLRKDELIGALSGETPKSATTVTERESLFKPEPRREREPVREPEPEPAAVEREPEPEPPRLITVGEVSAASIDLLDAVQHLVGQLSSSATKPGAADLEKIVESPTTKLLVARDDDDAVVGMLTLALFRIPTGVRAWIEDVVVDESARGRGAGEALTREAIRIATESGARTVDLTSRRERQAANRMYGKLGFNKRETTVYRIDAG